jgi:hypothetical protein
MIDMGTQETEFAGEKKKSRKLRLSFELPKKRADFDGVSKPMAIHKEIGFSMYSKANLRQYAEALLGKALSDKEADDLDVEILLGRGCLASVLHEKGTDGIVRAKFKGIQTLMDGMDSPRPENKVVFYSVTTGINGVFNDLPKWLQEKLVAAPEWESGSGEELASDDIPFN